MRPALLTLVLLIAALPARAASADLAAFVAAFRCEILDRLERIHAGDRSTSRDRYIVVSPRRRPDAYVQCIFFDRDARMLCEAASGAYRLKPGEVGPATPVGRPDALRALGYRPSPAGNDSQEIELGDPPNLDRAAELILSTLHEGFGSRLPGALTIRAPKAGRERAACAPVG